jgi:hypothetical protein
LKLPAEFVDKVRFYSESGSPRLYGLKARNLKTKSISFFAPFARRRGLLRGL